MAPRRGGEGRGPWLRFPERPGRLGYPALTARSEPFHPHPMRARPNSTGAAAVLVHLPSAPAVIRSCPMSKGNVREPQEAVFKRVRHGRLVMDEPTEFPEGTVIELVAVGGADHLDDEERARLHGVIDGALAESDEEGIDAADLLAELRARR